MRALLRRLLVRCAATTFGPRCPLGCGHRARGWRTLDAHLEFDHAGDPR